jgi:hypothetical protein
MQECEHEGRQGAKVILDAAISDLMPATQDLGAELVST